MAVFDDENVFGALPRKTATCHDIGQPLDTLSVDELQERIDMLQAEIDRLETQKGKKQASRRAADAFFQR